MLSNGSTEMMHIYFNKGDGSFEEPAIYDLGGIWGFTDHPLTVADINNDGWMDLLSCSGNGFLLILMINNGDGTFPEPVKLGIIYGNTQDSPQVADADKDGFLDVFVIHNKSVNPNEKGGLISFLKNKGDGTFFAPVTYDTLSSYSKLILEDVDNDGYVDMMTNNSRTDNISVFINNKDGSFAEPVSYQTGIHPRKISTADIDNNGWSDLLVSNLNSNDLSILLNNGDGTFASQVNYITGPRPNSITASDLNNDGWLDMIVSCDFKTPVPYIPTDEIWLYINNGDGSFAESGRYGRGKYFHEKAEIVDVDKDGLLDIIQSDSGYYGSNGNMSIFRNLGKGKFDNSGIDLRHEPNVKVSNNNDIDIFLDLRTFTEQVKVDLYFVMLSPGGKIYSGMGWNEGIEPTITGLILPPNLKLLDLLIFEFSIPSQKPPVIPPTGTTPDDPPELFTFAMALFKTGTTEMISFLTTTILRVVE